MERKVSTSCGMTVVLNLSESLITAASNGYMQTAPCVMTYQQHRDSDSNQDQAIGYSK